MTDGEGRWRFGSAMGKQTTIPTSTVRAAPGAQHPTALRAPGGNFEQKLDRPPQLYIACEYNGHADMALGLGNQGTFATNVSSYTARTGRPPIGVNEWTKAWRVATERVPEPADGVICRERGASGGVFLQRGPRNLGWPLLDSPKPTDPKRGPQQDFHPRSPSSSPSSPRISRRTCCRGREQAVRPAMLNASLRCPGPVQFAPRATGQIEKGPQKSLRHGAERLDEDERRREHDGVSTCFDKEIPEGDQEASVIKLRHQFIWEAFKDARTGHPFEPPEDETAHPVPY